MKTYWAIEDKKGNLIKMKVFSGTGPTPILHTTKTAAIKRISNTNFKDCKPVKVEIRRVSDVG